MSRERWMALFFALGSACFLIGPFPGYAQLVGATADAVTFFIGSILFTAGGALQTYIAYPERESGPAGRAAFRAAAIQSAGTLFFNVTTYQALHTSFVGLQLQPTRVAPGRIRLDLLPHLRRDRLPRLRPARLVARPRASLLVGTVDQPARLHLLRDLGRRRLPRPLYRRPSQPRRRKLEHRARSRMLPGVRGGHPADRSYRQIAPVAAPAQSRTRHRARRASDRLTNLMPGRPESRGSRRCRAFGDAGRRRVVWLSRCRCHARIPNGGVLDASNPRVGTGEAARLGMSTRRLEGRATRTVCMCTRRLVSPRGCALLSATSRAGPRGVAQRSDGVARRRLRR